MRWIRAAAWRTGPRRARRRRASERRESSEPTTRSVPRRSVPPLPRARVAAPPIRMVIEPPRRFPRLLRRRLCRRLVRASRRQSSRTSVLEPVRYSTNCSRRIARPDGVRAARDEIRRDGIPGGELVRALVPSVREFRRWHRSSVVHRRFVVTTWRVRVCKRNGMCVLLTIHEPSSYQRVPLRRHQSVPIYVDSLPLDVVVRPHNWARRTPTRDSLRRQRRQRRSIDRSVNAPWDAGG